MSHGSSFYVSRYASILFEGANTTTVGEMVGAVIIVLVVSVIYELLRRYKAYFDDPLGKCRCSCADPNTVVVEMRGAEKESTPSPTTDKPPLDQTIILPGNSPSKNSNAARKIQKICLRHKTIYTAISLTIHMISLTISYFLMLVAMTFNVWLFLAVIIGSALGKLITMTLVGEATADSSHSHCNMP